MLSCFNKLLYWITKILFKRFFLLLFHLLCFEDNYIFNKGRGVEDFCKFNYIEELYVIMIYNGSGELDHAFSLVEREHIFPLASWVFRWVFFSRKRGTVMIVIHFCMSYLKGISHQHCYGYDMSEWVIVV